MQKEEFLKDLLSQAMLAPSSHNTQPWVFKLGDDKISLYADRTRALPANDPDDRELTISCACALLNARAAAAARGVGVRMTLLPDPQEEDLLAEIRVGGDVESGLSSLGNSIPNRRTYRKQFDGREVSADALDRLRDEAAAEQAWLEPIIDERSRQITADLVTEGDAAQWADPTWRRELAAWMHPRRSGDGLTLPWLTVPIARIVVRTFDMGNGVGARDHALAEGSPVLAVLGTEGDNETDWLNAGQALERVLLVATGFGLQASYLNQAIQVPRLRPKLQNLINHEGYPQVLLRLGYPQDEITAAPRRPLAEVLEE